MSADEISHEAFRHATVPDALAAAVPRHGGRIVASEGGRHFSLSEIDRQARAAARGLMARGVAKGDRVAIWASNRIEWIIAGTAVQLAGGVIVPIGSRLRAPEAAVVIADAAARVLLCDSGFGDYEAVALIAAHDLPSLRTIVVFDGAGESGRILGWLGLLRLGDSVSAAALEMRGRSIDPDDLCDILFTSGTTGRPKGVPMTHRQSLIACDHSQRAFRFEPADVMPGIFPFAHNAGYRAGWQMAVLLGFRLEVFAQANTDELLHAAFEEKVSVLAAVPTIVQALLDHPGRANRPFPALRLASTGGTTVPVALLKRMKDELGARGVNTAYGMTETAGNISYTRIGSPLEIVATTSGPPVDNLEVRILGREGVLLPPGETGEIIVRGPQVLKHYWKRESAKAETFTPDGFFRTGDIGLCDAGGNIVITDRLKDMYICGGFNCYPAEIERVLLQIPGVQAAAVVGVEDARLGQVGCAYIVRRDPALDSETVIVFTRERLANYKTPRLVRFLDEMPRTSTGKADKVALRRLACGR